MEGRLHRCWTTTHQIRGYHQNEHTLLRLRPPLNRSWMQPLHSSSTFCMLASVCSKGRPNERQVPYIHGRRLHGHRRTCIFGCSQQASRASDGFPMSSPHGLTAPAAHAVCVATIDRLPLSMPYRASPLVPMLARRSGHPPPICSHLGQVSRGRAYMYRQNLPSRDPSRVILIPSKGR